MKYLIVLSLFLCAAAPLQAMVWQPAPAAPGAAPAGAHQGHGGGGGKPFVLRDGAGAAVTMWLPTRVRRPLALDATGLVSVPGTGLDNYHLLFARRVNAAGEEVALRYHYQQGKPSGESPSALLAAPKSMLEIVPAPLSREHQRYLSGKTHHFLLRFDGAPLSGQPVTLRSSNGSELSAESDGEGRVTFTLPDDFAEVQPGRGGNRPAEFVLATTHEHEGRAFHTTLSGPYYVNPSHWRSTGGALAAMFAGVVSGLLVLRRARHGAEAGRG